VTVAVWETGLASTHSTPGRRPSTASTTAFSLAQLRPRTSRTAVLCSLGLGSMTLPPPPAIGASPGPAGPADQGFARSTSAMVRLAVVARDLPYTAPSL